MDAVIHGGVEWMPFQMSSDDDVVTHSLWTRLLLLWVLTQERNPSLQKHSS